MKVGEHIAVSPGALPRFLPRLEAVYDRLGKAETILAAAAAHHRLLWIHPFLDGNGRVARLMSHATLRRPWTPGGCGRSRAACAQCGRLQRPSGRLRPVPAKCARRPRQPERGDARRFLAVLPRDLPRPGRVHGRAGPAGPARTRILLWAEEETRLGHLAPKAGQILEAVLYRGELPRADIPALLGVGERHARRIVGDLDRIGVLVSDLPRAPLRLAFPAALASRWMPGLFPERILDPACRVKVTRSDYRYRCVLKLVWRFLPTMM